ncbi:MAG: sigma-70 family RNA polymerase sigma factor [Clostridia bacterium]|nr:sigma-70 family RNA polymerase sigma factor [Clostridia bacterium]
MEKQKADKIITEYLKKIYGFAMKKSFSYHEAEDLCYDIIDEVYSSLLKSDEIENIEGYIWRISEHTYAKYVARKKKLLGVSLDNVVLPHYDEYFFENNNDETDLLRREIAFLSSVRRRIIFLFYYENKTISEISREISIPEGTVKWHLNKAKFDLKEGLKMERKIGNLGLNPIIALDMGHSGRPGNNGGPEAYIGDKLNLNLVYSVYHTPKTKDEIAEELGVTPVYIEDNIKRLEENGFLVKKDGKYTTYVKFGKTKYSKEMSEKKSKIQLEIAELLAKEYAPLVIEAVKEVKDVYIPGGNRELLYALAILNGIAEKCGISIKKDYSKYDIKTTDGGDYIAYVDLKKECEDPDYVPTLTLPSYWACGSMTRDSDKYPIYSWSIDSRYSSRKGGWQNNYTSDYEYLYEAMTGLIVENSATDDKFNRLRERKFLTEDGSVNILMVKGEANAFFDKIPCLSENLKEKYARLALEFAMMEAKYYPPQMQDLVVGWEAGNFIGTKVALMVMDILYSNGTFAPLTENEKVTANLIMFTDKLPNEIK